MFNLDIVVWNFLSRLQKFLQISLDKAEKVALGSLYFFFIGPWKKHCDNQRINTNSGRNESGACTHK